MKKEEKHPERLTEADFARNSARDTPELDRAVRRILAAEQTRKRALIEAAHSINAVRLRCYEHGITFDEVLGEAQATLLEQLD